MNNSKLESVKWEDIVSEKIRQSVKEKLEETNRYFVGEELNYTLKMSFYLDNEESFIICFRGYSLDIEIFKDDYEDGGKSFKKWFKNNVDRTFTYRLKNDFVIDEISSKKE